MKILHTSDWHLGKRLYDEDRYEVFKQFLNWLHDEIEEHQIDALIVAGDIFDTNVPSNKSKELYYDFVSHLDKTCCRHVVIVGGNHDSPTLLDAPRYLLSRAGVHVVGGAKDDLSEEIVELRESDGKLSAIVCAVPYLREKDILRIKDGSEHTREEEIVLATQAHYQTVTKKAVELMKSERVPLIGTGHLLTAGSRTDGDENELYIGSLGAVPASVFPKEISYLALGHLHRAQYVGSDFSRNYSGAPIAFNFSEAKSRRIVRIVDFKGDKLENVTDLAVPSFDRLESIRGDVETILERLKCLAEEAEPILAEVIHIGETPAVNLVELVTDAVLDSQIKVLHIRDESRQLIYTPEEAFISEMSENELYNLDHFQIFEHRLEAGDVEPGMKDELFKAYRQAYAALQGGTEGLEAS